MASAVGVAAIPAVEQFVDNVASQPGYYPPNDGFVGTAQRVTLETGTMLQRIGDLYGYYVAPAGTPPEMLSLPYEKIGLIPTDVEVLRPIQVLGGEVAPWFGQVGGGTQYLLDSPVLQLVNEGVLKIMGD